MTRPSSREAVAHEDIFAANVAKRFADAAGDVQAAPLRLILVHSISSDVVARWLMLDIGDEIERRTAGLEVQSRSAAEELVVLLRAAREESGGAGRLKNR